MRTALVTGGAGFIGANFLNRSVPERPDVRFVNVDCLTYAANPASLEAVAGASNYFHECVDIADDDAVEDVFDRYTPDLIVHFAAESHVDRSIVRPRAFVRTNVEGTLNLLEACRRHWGSRRGLFHHVSTDEVYGALGQSGRFSETSRYDPSSPYSASKAASDHLVRAWGRTFGLRFRLTNCSNNYGPYQFPEKLVPLMILNALERKPMPVYGLGENVRDWLYVGDHCDAIWAVVERGRDGETYNVGGGAELSNLEVVHRICASVARRTGADEAELRSLIRFVEDRPGHDFRYAVDSTKIRQECGWQPATSFDLALDATVQWYLEHADWVDGVRTGEYRRWIELKYGAAVAQGPE
jgi:dTDP-glucose 4,6-dehydratase